MLDLRGAKIGKKEGIEDLGLGIGDSCLDNPSPKIRFYPPKTRYYPPKSENRTPNLKNRKPKVKNLTHNLIIMRKIMNVGIIKSLY